MEHVRNAKSSEGGSAMGIRAGSKGEMSEKQTDQMNITLRTSKKDRTDADMALINKWCDDNQVARNKLLNSVLKALARELRDTEYQTVYPLLLQVKLPEKIYGRDNRWTARRKAN
jgi:hypothetical protein